MSLIVIAIGVGLLSIPLLTTRASLAPSAKVRIACGSAASGMSIVVTGTILTASPLSLRWHHGSETAGLALNHISPGGPIAWATGGLLGAMGIGCAGRVLCHTTRVRRQARLPRWAADSADHDDYADVEVRIAPTVRPVAFAVPGSDPHIVVSRTVTQLPEPERRAVVAHESAHIRLRHDRHLLVLTIYEHVWGWLPGVRAVVARHRHFIEQWADFHAVQNQRIDWLALLRARVALLSCGEASPSSSFDDVSTRSSHQHLIGVGGLVTGLIVAGIYSTTHIVGDLTTAIAALH